MTIRILSIILFILNVHYCGAFVTTSLHHSALPRLVKSQRILKYSLLQMVASPTSPSYVKPNDHNNNSNKRNGRGKPGGGSHNNNKGGKNKHRNSKDTAFEHKLRKTIHRGDWITGELLIRDQNSTSLESGRNLVYVIVETCKRANEMDAIVPLLREINPNKFECREDDILPMLNYCANKGDMRPAQRVLAFIESIPNIAITAKTFS